MVSPGPGCQGRAVLDQAWFKWVEVILLANPFPVELVHGQRFFCIIVETNVERRQHAQTKIGLFAR